MSSRTDKLDSLFERWRQSREEYEDKFSKDGIIKESAWLGASPKLLFLLKETNDFPDDIRVLIPNYWKGLWVNVGRWAYGLQKTAKGCIPSFTEASQPHNYKTAGESSAIMNLKKSPGKNQSNMEEIRGKAQYDKDFIKEELDIIQPEIVVCGAKFEIAKKIISELNCKPIDEDSKCYKIGETLWIDYCHPSARFRYDMMYYSLISLYQNYLRLNK